MMPETESKNNPKNNTEPEFIITDRGFKHLKPIPGAYGGEVTVYESSAAMHPHIWLLVKEPNDLNAWARGDQSEGLHEAHSHLRIEDAEKLRDQLTWLIENHYQNE